MSEWKETEIYPKVPAEWEEYCLGELGWFKNGLNFNKNAFGKGIPIINVTDLHKGRYVSIDSLDELRDDVFDDIDEYLLKIGDILFARSSVKLEGTGQVALVKNLPSKNTCFSGFIIRYRIQDKNTDPEFVNYLLRSPNYREFFISIATGTSIFNLTQEILSSIPVYLPSISEQRAIVSVLSSLDDKIDLLHRQNKTLEAMAETLFRQWFVEEAEESWEDKYLGEYFTVRTGKKDANYSTEDGPYPFFTCSQTTLQAPDYSFEGHAILLAGNGDFNIKRYIGKFEAYQRTYVLIPYDVTKYNFLYILMRYFLTDITGGFQGSVINFITKGMIEDFAFKIPHGDLTNKLTLFDSIYEIFDFNTVKICTLERLRDTLLPKLMSGEIRVEA